MPPTISQRWSTWTTPLRGVVARVYGVHLAWNCENTEVTKELGDGGAGAGLVKYYRWDYRAPSF